MYQQEVEDLKVELSRAEFLEKVHLLIISKIVTDLNNHHLDQSPHFTGIKTKLSTKLEELIRSIACGGPIFLAEGMIILLLISCK